MKYTLIVKFLIVSLVAIMIFPQNVSAVELDNNSDILAVERLLEVNKVDVLFELDDLVGQYQLLLENTESMEEQQKINDLISGVKNLAQEYKYFDGSKEPEIYLQTTSANPPNIAVTMVIAYFKNCGYDLAAELLIHSTLNQYTSSTYVPVYGSNVKYSSIFKSIALGTSTSGSATFTKSGNTQSVDCYYAIHKFNYTKTSSASKTVTINDVYDYAQTNEYTGVAGIAVSTMYQAQLNGSIVPFKVKISATYTG